MLPTAFTERMRRLLGDEFPAFMRAMTEEPASRAVRVNPLKFDPLAFAAHPPFAVRPIAYAADGFFHEQEKIGHHPYHHAGILYAQDPGAMSTLCAYAPKKSDRVLDMCAAPGGKSAQLAAAIGREGVLVANEYVAARAKLLVGNFERLGIPNAIVTNSDAATLAAHFHAVFDFVLVDAPCSGEGMFRKNAEAVADWSEEKVRKCAALQADLLHAAAATLRTGGYLLYSTCTFAPEENEQQVAAFLRTHPEFRLMPVSEAVADATRPGIDLPDCSAYDMSLTRRFYPHIAAGEGQFIALMQKTSGETDGCFGYRDAAEQPRRATQEALRTFFSDCLDEATGAALAARVRSLGGKLVLPPADFPLPPRAVFAAGCAVGEERNGRILPHHQFFTTHGSAFRRKLCLSLDDVRTERYLHGETVPAPDLPNGYTAVLLDGAVLGGAKVVDGIAKNLYPKGLRKQGG